MNNNNTATRESSLSQREKVVSHKSEQSGTAAISAQQFNRSVITKPSDSEFYGILLGSSATKQQLTGFPIYNGFAVAAPGLS